MTLPLKHPPRLLAVLASAIGHGTRFAFGRQTNRLVLAGILAGTAALAVEPAPPRDATVYPDGRPAATLRLEAKDQGVLLKHGDGPGQGDILGAREALIFEENGVYHLFSPEEQIENSSLYFEPTNKTWFLFTNPIGVDGHEYTDAVWVYWSKDLNAWDAKNKAVVLDGANCRWSRKCIGMPSVIAVGNRLAIFYDAPGGNKTDHMNRDLGLAWLELPLTPPSEPLRK